MNKQVTLVQDLINSSEHTSQNLYLLCWGFRPKIMTLDNSSDMSFSVSKSSFDNRVYKLKVENTSFQLEKTNCVFETLDELKTEVDGLISKTAITQQLMSFADKNDITIPAKRLINFYRAANKAHEVKVDDLEGELKYIQEGLAEEVAAIKKNNALIKKLKLKPKASIKKVTSAKQKKAGA